MRTGMSKARIEDGMLVISVSISALSHAARYCQYFDFCRETGGGVEITDEAAFAESVRRALNQEDEDGSTAVTRMLDKAFSKVVDNGDDGVEAVEAGG